MRGGGVHAYAVTPVYSVFGFSTEGAPYNDAVKAIDPNRLTCQADNLTPDSDISQYSPYVTATDVFMPEIYPVRGKVGDPSDKYCVAMTIRMMEQMRRDVERFGDGKPRACWPILQWFKGWNDWHHFPTRDQLFATSFAAIVHGANGILWYTYGGFFEKEKNRLDEGITSTPERWRDICDLASLVREISPALLEEVGTRPKAEIVSGPAADPFGGASVTALLKRHGGSAYLIAVNAAPEAVRARFSLGDVEAEGEVLCEGRCVTCRSGTLEDDFKPFGVHVYRFCPIEKYLPPLPEGAFTYAVIPDTQSYDGEGRHTKRGRAPGKGPTRNPKFDAIVDWLLANAQKENILFVTHTGDIVDMNNDRVLTEEELVRNRNVDAVRYFGELGVTNVFVVAGGGSQAETGAYKVEGLWTFTAKTVKNDVNKTVPVARYVIETFVDGQRTGKTVYNGNSFTYSESNANYRGKVVRLTWKPASPGTVVILR